MQDDFGAELRRARMRKGLDVNTVARRLRIRPDIIQAIEDSDFDRMPPRGYARNMINSYAHLLGLNASEITARYLDEQYAYQVNSARKNARGTGFDMPSSRTSASRQQRSQEHYEVSGYERGDLSQPRNARPRDRLRGEERGGRRMYDDFDSGRIMSRSEAERTYRNAGHRSRGSALGEEPIFNAVASPAHTNTFGGRFANLNLPLIGVIVVAVLLVIVVLALAFGPKGSSDATNLPVESASEAASESSSSSLSVNPPTSFTFSYTVNSGASTWIEVYIDGKQEVAQNVEGPATKTFTTSGELEFICADPSGVKATQDGKDVALTPNSEGVVDIKINFNDVLKAWQAEHGAGEVASSSSSSNSLRGINEDARAASSTSSSSDDEEGEAEAEDEENADEPAEEEEDFEFYDDEGNADEFQDEGEGDEEEAPADEETTEE